jgi:hypothetical protein
MPSRPASSEQRSKVVCPAALVSSKRAAEAIKIGANATDQINEAVAALSHPVAANAAPK